MKTLFNWTTLKHATTSMVLLYFWTRWIIFPLVLIPLFLLVWMTEKVFKNV